VSLVTVAVDFGTSSTCAAVAVGGEEPRLVVLDGGAPVMPSAVFADQAGALFVGHEAERQAAIDPSRYEPHPKRRVDEGQLLLGDTVLAVGDVIRAVLGRAVDEAKRLVGGAPVDLLVLTHPADWGVVRTRILRQAGNGLAAELRLVPEPVAAAVFYAFSTPVRQGTALAVLDVGDGTVDASVVRRNGDTFDVLATRGDPAFGGADVDHALLEYIGTLVSAGDPGLWRSLLEGRELADRRRRRVLHQDVRGAKETLSRHAYTDVPMPLPFSDAHVTRADLERLIRPRLVGAVTILAEAIAAAGLCPGDLSAVFLVGGSSRIPLLGQLVQHHVGLMPSSLDQPETVVVRGAIRAVTTAFGRNQGRRPAVPAPGAASTGVATQRSQEPVVGSAAAVRSTSRSARRSLPWIVVGTVVLVAIAVVTVVRITGTTPSGRSIAQYDYRFTIPPGWSQSGGDPGSREVRIAPDGSGSNTDPAAGGLIAVQERALTYDSTAERSVAVGQIRDAVRSGGPAFSGFADSYRFAGRDVIYYRQSRGDALVDWYVVLEGRAQVSVGCQYTGAERDTVLDGCARVVSTLDVQA